MTPPFIKSSRGLGISSMIFWFFAFIIGMNGLFSNHLPLRLEPILNNRRLRNSKISFLTFGVFNSSDAYESDFNLLISTKRFFGILAGLGCLISGIFFFASVMTWYYYMVLRFRETYDSLSPYIGLREPRADSITMEADTGFILGKFQHQNRQF